MANPDENESPQKADSGIGASGNGDGFGETIPLATLVHSSDRLGGMVVRSAQVRKVLKSVSQLSPYRATVLVSGESGTGKELIARALHTLGPAPGGPFVTLNCSNLVESLAESQLFGHVRGAFTDAREESQGYFRSANGGTLFLDEIGELPLKLQPKLLRSVEAHEVQPVGSSNCHKVELRLVAATNRDLRAMVKAGTFRDDLYYRLSASAIFIPPLRERREAIPAFIGYFIEQYNRQFGKGVSEISRRAMDILCAYQWPGNVRELSNAIESAVIVSEGNKIKASDIPEQIVDGTGADLLYREEESAGNGSLATQIARRLPAIDFAGDTPGFLLDDVIKKTLIRSLEETEGNRRRAADLLGVSRSTLYRMLTRYGIAEGPTRSGLQPSL
ncbi:MAG TPA: sigma-54 dependent transcriptional regulator [Candidatus Binatus sp.]|nr:sigma-54 dependent transcriptional regulator [Candidatus Binatus sp.]